MNRWLLASMIVGMGLACGTYALSPARAQGQERESSKQEKGSAKQSRGREEGSEDPAQRIDKAIQEYESRADQDLDQSRKDIERLRKEAVELVQTQLDMLISVAELQAEMRVQAAAPSGGGDENGDSGKSASDSGRERQRLRSLELTRELRQVRENLRSLVTQKRDEVDQLVVQLRNLRAQQRQRESEREKSKQGTDPSKD